jgi:(1->4)-alpha-D-glucan 1-alpha-D-glucosylmutase
LNAHFRTGKYPDRNTEYLLYQTLVGAWPITQDRVVAYIEKATREAKQQTSWTQQNKEFEESLRVFIEKVLESGDFVTQLEKFVESALLAGRINSLAQTLLKFTAPGVPDTYQGSELWDLSLVDPDNRRPVDYELRKEMLAELQRGVDIAEIVRRMDSGLPKLWVAHKALCVRRDHPEWFVAESVYSPILAEGSKSDHLVGYQRGDSVAVLVPRWPLKLHGNWSSTTVELTPGNWKNILTNEFVIGGRVRVQTLLQRFPVALLTREAE